MLKEERFDDVAALYIHIVEREPAEADLFQELVPQMREAGAMGAANQILLTAGPFHGNDPHFLFDLAHEHQQLGNLDEASECYQQLLAIEPEHLQAYRHLGEVLLELDRNEQAQEVLEAARKVMPGNARITNLLGVVHHRHGRFKEAARLYQKAARLDKTDSDYPLNEGFAWRDLGEVQKAADALDRALERDPDDTYLLQEAGLLWLELDLDRAVELFQHATRIDGEDPYNYRLLGDALRRASEYNQARDAFRTAIDIDPGDHFSYNGLGLIHEAQDELDQAIERYRKAAELLPEEPVYHRNLGFRLMDDHAADEAIRTLEKAVELEPGHAMTHAILGQLYRDNDQAEKALYHLREAQRLEPDDPNSRRELGYLLHDMRDYEGAIDSYREGLVCDPEDALTHFNLGQALLLLEQFEEAECHLRRAAELDGDCNPYPELGVALHRLGKTEASR
ncbi:MAG: tetratricopeptide repeat protein, partial [Acidobacteriota bacterium]|nr:tetratricopeptide repeat protein [Acidobacteriota bacterium]